MGKLKLFPVTFSLLGTGESPTPRTALVRRLEARGPGQLSRHELRNQNPRPLREELAVEWFEKQAGDLIKTGHRVPFQQDATRRRPQELPVPEGRHQAARCRDPGRGRPSRENLPIDLKGVLPGALRLTSTTGSLSSVATTGCSSSSNEFRSWQERHEGQPSYEEGVQLLETLAYYLPVEEHKNIRRRRGQPGRLSSEAHGSGGGGPLRRP